MIESPSGIKDSPDDPGPWMTLHNGYEVDEPDDYVELEATGSTANEE